MNNTTACQCKRGSEMVGHLLPTGFLMEGKNRQESNIQSPKKIPLYLTAVLNLFHNTVFLNIREQRHFTGVQSAWKSNSSGNLF